MTNPYYHEQEAIMEGTFVDGTSIVDYNEYDDPDRDDEPEYFEEDYNTESDDNWLFGTLDPEM